MDLQARVAELEREREVLMKQNKELQKDNYAFLERSVELGKLDKVIEGENVELQRKNVDLEKLIAKLSRTNGELQKQAEELERRNRKLHKYHGAYEKQHVELEALDFNALTIDNRYLQKLLSEMKDKTNVLRHNNDLLMQKVDYLETSRKTDSVGRGLQTLDIDSSRFVSNGWNGKNQQNSNDEAGRIYLNESDIKDRWHPEKQQYFYLHHVIGQGNEAVITKYIKNRLHGTVENIHVREIPTGGNGLRHFVVSAPSRTKNELFDEKFWPSKVKIAEFDFNEYFEFVQLNLDFFFPTEIKLSHHRQYLMSKLP